MNAALLQLKCLQETFIRSTSRSVEERGSDGPRQSLLIAGPKIREHALGVVPDVLRQM